MITKFWKLLFIAALVIMASSCNHKELCYENIQTSKLRVVYDWSDAPEATPGGMCVFFYSLDDTDLYYRFDFDNITGGDIELPAGRYALITYNNDTEVVRFSATNIFEGHTASTRIGDLLEPLYGNGVTSTATTDNGEPVMVTPDNLWGCHVTEVTVSEHGVKYTFTRASGDANTTNPDDQTITLYPHDMLCHYSYEVRNVDNAQHISRVSASLSGMSGSMSLKDETLDHTPVTLPVSGQTAADKNMITGQFLTFGHNAANAAKHKMTFYVVMDNGSKYVVKDAPNLDVTSQVDTARNQRRVHIIIDGLKLPQTTGDDNGFSPTVDDWGVSQEDLKL